MNDHINNAHALTVSSILQPGKAENFDGQREFLAANTWILEVDQYLPLAQLSNPNSTIRDSTRIMFACLLLAGMTDSGWFNRFKAGLAPTCWDEFKVEIIRQCLPEDHKGPVLDRLCNFRQNHHSIEVSFRLPKYQCLNIIYRVELDEVPIHQLLQTKHQDRSTSILFCIHF